MCDMTPADHGQMIADVLCEHTHTHTHAVIDDGWIHVTHVAIARCESCPIDMSHVTHVAIAIARVMSHI